MPVHAKAVQPDFPNRLPEGGSALAVYSPRQQKGISKKSHSLDTPFLLHFLLSEYEPIWAIGTGKTATTEQAQEVCKAVRDCIAEIYDEATAEAVRIQYGGSVNAGNAAELSLLQCLAAAQNRYKTCFKGFLYFLI